MWNANAERIRNNLTQRTQSSQRNCDRDQYRSALIQLSPESLKLASNYSMPFLRVLCALCVRSDLSELITEALLEHAR